MAKLLDSTSSDLYGDSVGIADYLDSRSDAPVVAKLETGLFMSTFLALIVPLVLTLTVLEHVMK